jgi:hypothetical protein
VPAALFLRVGERQWRSVYENVNQQLRDRTALRLRTRRSARSSPSAASTTVLRGLLRRETPKETGHRAPDLGLHQLTNDRDDALLSRHPPPPCYEDLNYPRPQRIANTAGEQWPGGAGWDGRGLRWRAARHEEVGQLLEHVLGPEAPRHAAGQTFLRVLVTVSSRRASPLRTACHMTPRRAMDPLGRGAFAPSVCRTSVKFPPRVAGS